MVTREDVESYLFRLEENVQEVGPSMWVLESEAGSIVVHYSPPLLILRAKVVEVPADEGQCTALFRKLLELNAGDLIHGAYAIEEGDVILTDTLELERVDFGIFQASVDSMQLALASHPDALSAHREC